MQANSSAWRSTASGNSGYNNHSSTPTAAAAATATSTVTETPPLPLPQYSRKFARSSLYNSDFPDTYFHNSGTRGAAGSSNGLFFDAVHPPSSTLPFTPSYLRNSSYAARLHADHQRERARARSGVFGDHQDDVNAASRYSAAGQVGSQSVAGFPRIAPSHRGMTHEVIERDSPSMSSDAANGAAAGAEDEAMPKLPSRWSDTDRHTMLETLHGGLEVKYTGPLNKHDHEAAAVRTDHAMPPQCGIYYFEITILSKPKEGMIGVGFSSNKASVERLPGWETESWAYHGDDGKSFYGETQGQGRPYGPTFGVNDTVGCGVNFSTMSAFFTKNGVFLGNAFRELKSTKLYPSVGMKKQPTVHLVANFGQQPFIFDIDGMVQKEKASVYSEINATSTAGLCPPLNEDALMHELVAQFLAHDGYVETARAFAEEVASESAALHGRGESLKKYEVEEDLEAINRQKIRAAILDGDIDKALKYTNAYYPKVLGDYPHIQFKLRCRKFLEMMRRQSSSDFPPSTAAKRGKPGESSNGVTDSMHAAAPAAGGFGQEMEVDDGDGWGEATDGMDTADDPETAAKFQMLLTEAVQYGQQLRMDYPGDDNGGNKRMLDDIFSLVAYPDPRRSVHGHYLDPAGRVAVAEELNSAILVSLGKASSAALERVYQQTEALLNEISEEGGSGAFINLAMASSSPVNNENATKAEEQVSDRVNHAHRPVSSVQSDDDYEEEEVADATTADRLATGTAISSDPSAAANVRCCCGDTDCAFFLEHLRLERDLDTAARLGQALLHRHESYMADAEGEQRRLLNNIVALEEERRAIQTENTRIMAENRGLAEQVDWLNNSVTDSEAQINSLSATLQNTEAEMRRVSAACGRATELENELAKLEAEQAALQEGLVTAQDGEKAAVQRWKRTEATLRDLQAQVEQMEHEAAEEREHHAEVVQRLERRRTVERELDGAAGRLKGAAAAAAHEVGRQPIVSRFVRDILQDNAKLQIGITEMRELLENSHQEVQGLREAALRGSRPGTAKQISDEEKDRDRDGDGDSETKPSSALPRRLSQELDNVGSPEYHIHHHYHPKEGPRLYTRRMNKKRRSVGFPAALHSAAHLRNSSTSSTSTVLTQNSAAPSSRRWSYQTAVTDSIASSPNSIYRPASVFDHERSLDSECTSPADSAAFQSPVAARHRKQGSIGSPLQDTLGRVIDDELAGLNMYLPWNDSSVPAIPEEQHEDQSSAASFVDRPRTPHDIVRRKPSQDSLFSVAGMDIHTPVRQSRAVSRSKRYNAHSLSCGREFLSTPPVIATTTITADGQAPSKPSEQSPRKLLESVAGTGNNASPPTNFMTAASIPAESLARKSSFSRRVSGWMRGKWGNDAMDPNTAAAAAAETSTASTAPSASVSGSITTQSQTSEEQPATPNAPQGIPVGSFRNAGVNQKGPIWGFRPPGPAPTVLQPAGIDERLLQESLAE